VLNRLEIPVGDLITTISEKESDLPTLTDRLVPKINLKTVNPAAKSRNTNLITV
jgi:hypothetical protein